jgi:Protein of unknown function (DUF3072)
MLCRDPAAGGLSQNVDLTANSPRPDRKPQGCPVRFVSGAAKVEMPMTADNKNPKRDPTLPSNTAKDPKDWVSGDEPMTGAQASYLKTLSKQAQEPEAFDASLTKAEASKRIDALKAKLDRARG